MTYGEVRDAALQLINQYTIAGDKIAPTYNNQQDYLNRIPFLVNDAQMYIATTAKRIPASTPLSRLAYTEAGRWRIYRMPGDFFQFHNLSALVIHGHEPTRVPFLRTEGSSQFMLSPGVPEDSIIDYYRYPNALAAEPADSEELDNTIETHQAIPYYVAAHIVMQDDPYQQASLYNEFETRMSRLGTPVTVEHIPIADSYAFGLTSHIGGY